MVRHCWEPLVSGKSFEVADTRWHQFSLQPTNDFGIAPVT
jgi:hypothetical protein